MSLRIATVNVNGIRAAARKGMADWVTERTPDVLTMQEVRATIEQAQPLIPSHWHVTLDESNQKGRAGVAVLTRNAPLEVRRELGDDSVDSAGRWLEVDVQHGEHVVTVVSCYTHSGEVDTPKQEAKWAFLEAQAQRMRELAAERDFVVVTGDFNIGHTELDIKNWKGNVKRAGFLPRERGYLSRMFGEADAEVTGVDGSLGAGLGYVDVGRTFAGEVPGPYTWWSNRGQAFDNDSGWRIDYHAATPKLAATVENYAVDRAAAYDQRWSDHAPVVVDYAI